jgi:hypothetical protein
MRSNVFLCGCAYSVAVFLLTVCLCASVYGRDVNLDTIYIKSASPYIARLTEAKADSLKAVSARRIDSNIAFCGWSTGSAVLYVKDEDSVFKVYEYYLSSGTRRFIAQGRGAVVHAVVPSNGKYILVKSLITVKNNIIPQGLFSVVSVRTSDVKEYSSRSQFIDFSATSFGISYLREDNNGISEYFPDGNSHKTILSRDRYYSLIDKDQAVVPFLSPDASTIAVLNGGGGRYKTLFFKDGNNVGTMSGVNTASEYLWIDSRTIAYRTGSPGNYFPAVYSVDSGKSRMFGKKSMNTNISYSTVNGIVSYLTDGCISFYNVKADTSETYPVEGEDVLFSPNGNSFCALSGGNLYILQRELLKSRNIELRRTAVKILQLYRDALSDVSSHENDFSREYLERKVRLYGELSK